MKLGSLLTTLLASGINDGSTSNTRATSSLITDEVCLSPGCIADGSVLTLEKLQALAPPNIIVREGGCSSACGNGPVVIRLEVEKKKAYRKVAGAKILDLLTSDVDDSSRPPKALVQGYDLVLQADKAFSARDYQLALDIYTNAVELALEPAMDLQSRRNELQFASSSESSDYVIGLEWLIRAKLHQAIALLQLDGAVSTTNDAALLAARTACDLSRNCFAQSFQVLASVYEKSGNVKGEVRALRSMFAIPVKDEEKLPIAI